MQLGVSKRSKKLFWEKKPFKMFQDMHFWYFIYTEKTPFSSQKAVIERCMKTVFFPEHALLLVLDLLYTNSSTEWQRRLYGCSLIGWSNSLFVAVAVFIRVRERNRAVCKERVFWRRYWSLCVRVCSLFRQIDQGSLVTFFFFLFL